MPAALSAEAAAKNARKVRRSILFSFHQFGELPLEVDVLGNVHGDDVTLVGILDGEFLVILFGRVESLQGTTFVTILCL